ncbi:MAG: DUF4249 domain-containing protein [Flavobacteriaceae bacterium]|nr:DUF4249 domain-containing protein [Flavobacteriaceae bacterium]
MKNQKRHLILLVAVLGLFLNSCLEEFDFQTETFESAIVVEATITNELKNHEILITRTFRFEEDGPSTESNADVRIVDGNGMTYNFQEVEPGVYRSINQFSAQSNVNYQLFITTSNGRTYESQTAMLTNITQIDNLQANRITNDDGENGMQILVNSFDPTGNSIRYRYEYEETYKIIAPFWNPSDLIVISAEEPFEVAIAPKTQEERICFGSASSNSIILTDTNDFTEDRVSDFEVRFLNSNNYIISHRYSILVRQFVMSAESYNFYRTLRDLSNSESLFNQNQPGFLAGNVFSTINQNEKVIGYFDVSSVDSERLFFNYSDFYTNEPLPPYASGCALSAPELTSPGPPSSSPLIAQIQAGILKYFNDNDAPGEGEGPYYMVPRACGDCTALGSNIVPSFWVD